MIVLTNEMLEAADKAMTMLPLKTKEDRLAAIKAGITAALSVTPIKPAAYTAEMHDTKGEMMLQFPLYHVPWAFPLESQTFLGTIKRAKIESLIFNNREYFGIGRDNWISMVNSDQFDDLWLNIIMRTLMELIGQVNQPNAVLIGKPKCSG